MNGGMMRWFLSVLALLCGLALVLGFGGRFHGGGDTLAVGRPAVVAALAGVSVMLLVWRVRLLGVVGLCLALLGGVSMAPPAFLAERPAGAQVYAIYQKNLLFFLPDTGPVAEDILATGADFVTLQELHARNRPILGTLRKAYPSQQFCPITQVGGIAVLSRWPATGTAPKCDDQNEWAAMQVETPDGPLWLVSVHLRWPYPYGQRVQVTRILPALKALGGPVVVGGDFNMVPWSFTVAEISRATRTRSAGYAGGTFALSYHQDGRDLAARMPRLPIDHVLVPDIGAAVSLDRRARLGSDHHGVLAKFVIER